MNKIYNSKVKLFQILFLFIGLSSFNFSMAQEKNETNLPFAFVPKQSNYSLELKRNSNVAIMIVMSESPIENLPGNFSDYRPNTEFKGGSAVGSAFVVYKGIETSIEITGLKAATNHYVWVYETNPVGVLKNITNEVFGSDISDNLSSQKTNGVTAVVCAAVGGIVCTLNGSTTSGDIAGPVACNGAAPFATANPWDGGSCAGFISFTFSSPVKVATIKMIAVNSTVDKTTVTATGGTGGALTMSSPVCMTFAGTVLGPYNGGGSYGDVAVNVTSAGTYLTLTCTNTGCNSGWVAACPTFLSVLPIELVSFSGECNAENVVDLKWKTISEKNNDFFTIERSNNTYDWEIIGRMDGAGNSTQINEYRYIDKQRFNETIYYRIKQTDFSGEFKYSEMVAVSNCKLTATSIDEVSIYPNPVIDELTVNSNSNATTIEIYNALGVMVAKKNLDAGENKLNTSDLKAGTYYVKISDATSASKMTKLIITH